MRLSRQLALYLIAENLCSIMFNRSSEISGCTSGIKISVFKNREKKSNAIYDRRGEKLPEE